MARIRVATRESVPEDQKEAFDEIVRTPGVVTTAGPYSILINVPEMARRGFSLSHYLRLESVLSPRTQELAMLTTARELDCQYIWNAHASAGRKAGLRDDIVDNLRDKKELTGLTHEEVAVVNYAQEFFRTHQVRQATFDTAMANFGIRGLTELTNLMGFYAMLAFNINAFGVDLPEERTEPVLPID